MRLLKLVLQWNTLVLSSVRLDAAEAHVAEAQLAKEHVNIVMGQLGLTLHAVVVIR